MPGRFSAFARTMSGFSAAKLFFAYGLGNALTFPMSVGATAVLNPGAADAGGHVFVDEPIPAHALLRRADAYSRRCCNDETHAAHKGSHRLRVCTSAGEALPESHRHRWKARFGVDILDGVGSTEMLHIFLSNAPDDIAYGTLGPRGAGLSSCGCVDEAGTEVADGEVGEL